MRRGAIDGQNCENSFLKTSCSFLARKTSFGLVHASKAQNPSEPRDRLPAGSPIAEMVAQEQKTNSPNFSIITEEFGGCQPQVPAGSSGSGRVTGIAPRHPPVTLPHHRACGNLMQEPCTLQPIFARSEL